MVSILRLPGAMVGLLAFCSGKVVGRGNSGRSIVKVAALVCNVRLN
jgi:hypothetical protein